MCGFVLAVSEAEPWRESSIATACDRLPLCRNCDVWAKDDYQESIRDGILIREAPLAIYYNRLDRMNTWGGGVRGGHVVGTADGRNGDE